MKPHVGMEVGARIVVRNAGTHDVIEEAFFPEKTRPSGPKWSTVAGSPWPTIVLVCRELLGDLHAEVAR